MTQALERLTRAWTPALGEWWARERARHVAMIKSLADDADPGPSTIEACRSVLMSGRACGLIFTDLEGLAEIGAKAWDADLLVNVLGLGAGECPVCGEIYLHRDGCPEIET